MKRPCLPLIEGEHYRWVARELSTEYQRALERITSGGVAVLQEVRLHAP